MQDYGSSSYGDAFADVYDLWYSDITDVEASVAALAGLAERAGATQIVELGCGTGRLLVPLANRVSMALPDALVIGVDTSAAMLDRLRAKHPAANVRVVLGDMVDDLPAAPLDLVFVAFNTFFSLGSASAQQRCFIAVAEHLSADGVFVIEAFVPDEPARAGDHVEVRSMTASSVVLSISRYGADQTAEGHLVELTESGGVRLRPWSIRYATVAELDAMAEAAGLRLVERWESFANAAFTDDSQRHVSVYARQFL